MIKFSMQANNGGTIVGLGLEEGNIERLKDGKPIYFPLKELGIEGVEIMIMYGETQEAIRDELRKSGLKGI